MDGTAVEIGDLVRRPQRAAAPSTSTSAVAKSGARNRGRGCMREEKFFSFSSTKRSSPDGRRV
jgi:hypothetical protein